MLPHLQSRRIHDEFNYDDERHVTFMSCDNVIFKLHRKNLEVAAGGFPGPEFETYGETSQLQESANILEVLFQFAYPERRPKVVNLEFSILAMVAEAAEKYQMYAAMDACEIRLGELVRFYPVPILTHAIKHGYPELIDASALHLCLVPACDVLSVEGFPQEYSTQWNHFHETCRHTVFHDASLYADRACVKEEYSELYQLNCALGVRSWILNLQESVPTTLDEIRSQTWDRKRCSREHNRLWTDWWPEDLSFDFCHPMIMSYECIKKGVEKVERLSFALDYLKMKM